MTKFGAKESSIEGLMDIQPIPPYLTTSHSQKRCSKCGEVFPKDSKPSISKAFAEHVKAAHRGNVTETPTLAASGFSRKK